MERIADGFTPWGETREDPDATPEDRTGSFYPAGCCGKPTGGAYRAVGWRQGDFGAAHT